MVQNLKSTPMRVRNSLLTLLLHLLLIGFYSKALTSLSPITPEHNYSSIHRLSIGFL